jgi:PAS domain S-box-containing protein
MRRRINRDRKLAKTRGGEAKTPRSRDDRRKAEEARRESEYKLRQIVDAVPSFLWSADPAGEPTYVNRRALEYSGMRLEDFMHGGWEALIHPADFPETLRAFEHAIKTGASYEIVHRLRRSDGEYRWHHARGEPLRDRDGRIIQWYGLAVDIDEARKAEDRLRQSEVHLAQAQRLSHTGSWAVRGTTTLHWSEESYRIWGFDPLQGLPTSPAMLQRIHPDDRDRLMGDRVRLIQTGRDARRRQKKDFTADFRIILPDGTVKYLESEATIRYFGDEGDYEAVGTHVDVTERKRAEEALRRDEAWLAQAQRLSHTGTWVMNGTTRDFLYWSDESYRIWGVDPLQGLPSREDFWGRIHPDDRKRVWGEVQEAMRRKRDLFAEFRTLLPDGTVKYLEASTHHEFSPHGALLEVVCTNVDVTERRRAEDELRATQARLARASQAATVAELSASIAHEINQPLAGIVASAQTCRTWLSGEHPNLPRAQAAIERIIRDGNAAADIIRRVRALFIQTAPTKTSLNINAVIEELRHLAQNELNRRGVSIELDLAQTLPPVLADRIQIQQVLMNLIRNGAEAMDDAKSGAKRLIVCSHCADGCIVVEVCDFGPGLAHPDKAFEPFYSTKKNGLGVGLAISRSVVQAHGGVLRVRDNQPQGAVFSFTLPLGEA